MQKNGKGRKGARKKDGKDSPKIDVQFWIMRMRRKKNEDQLQCTSN